MAQIFRSNLYLDPFLSFSQFEIQTQFLLKSSDPDPFLKSKFKINSFISKTLFCNSIFCKIFQNSIWILFLKAFAFYISFSKNEKNKRKRKRKAKFQKNNEMILEVFRKSFATKPLLKKFENLKGYFQKISKPPSPL